MTKVFFKMLSANDEWPWLLIKKGFSFKSFKLF